MAGGGDCGLGETVMALLKRPRGVDDEIDAERRKSLRRDAIAIERSPADLPAGRARQCLGLRGECRSRSGRQHEIDVAGSPQQLGDLRAECACAAEDEYGKSGSLGIPHRAISSICKDRLTINKLCAGRIKCEAFGQPFKVRVSRSTADEHTPATEHKKLSNWMADVEASSLPVPFRDAPLARKVAIYRAIPRGSAVGGSGL